MDTKKLLILAITVIIICAIVGVSAYITSVKETQVAIDLSEINQGDNLTINLTDENGKPLVNKTVEITINNKTYNRTTDDSGRCQIAINLAPGDYNITVNYNGEFLLKSSNITKELKVLNPNKQSSSQYSGDGIYYDSSLNLYFKNGRVIDIHGRPNPYEGRTYEDMKAEQLAEMRAGGRW